jgi:hypothetical protein
MRSLQLSQALQLKIPMRESRGKSEHSSKCCLHNLLIAAEDLFDGMTKISKTCFFPRSVVAAQICTKSLTFSEKSQNEREGSKIFDTCATGVLSAVHRERQSVERSPPPSTPSTRGKKLGVVLGLG